MSFQQIIHLDIEAARRRLQEVGDVLDQKYGIRCTWEGNTCHLSGTGIKNGVLQLTESSIAIQITLSLLAKPLKSKIQSEIQNQFDRVFA